MMDSGGSQNGNGPGAAFQQAAAQPKVKEKQKVHAPFSIRFTDEERERLDLDAGTLSLAAYTNGPYY